MIDHVAYKTLDDKIAVYMCVTKTQYCSRDFVTLQAEGRMHEGETISCCSKACFRCNAFSYRIKICVKCEMEILTIFYAT